VAACGERLKPLHRLPEQIMRAEIVTVVDEIKQSLVLLRRHL
jgi:hypothetical protein